MLFACFLFLSCGMTIYLKTGGSGRHNSVFYAGIERKTYLFPQYGEGAV